MKIERRTILKGAIASIGTLLGTRLKFLFPEVQADSPNTVYLPFISQSPQVLGDFAEHAGFLVVPLGALIPAMVSPPELQPPIICGIAGTTEHVNGDRLLFETPANLRDFVKFSIYGLEDLPEDIVYLNSSALAYTDSDDIYSTTVTYQAESTLGVKVSPISINARQSFAKPFPVHRTDPVFEGEPFVDVVAYDALPMPGVRYNGIDSFIFQWIEDDVLYTVRQDNTLFYYSYVDL